jgi:hypothetical protein
VTSSTKWTGRLRRLRVLPAALALALAIWLVWGGTPAVYAAAPSSAGTDFYFAVGKTGTYTETSVIVFISGETATTGTISISDGSIATQNFAVTSGQVTKVEFGTPARPHIASSPLNAVSNKGIRVQTGAPVSVYVLVLEPFVTDAHMLIPTNAVGTRYVVSSNRSFYSEQYGSYDNGILVVAHQDSTVVTVTVRTPYTSPSTLDADWTATFPDAGTVYTATLNAGQVFNPGRVSTDLAGSLVESNKAVTVIADAGCMNVPIGIPYCDRGLDTLPPINTWGKRYFAIPSSSRTKGDTFRIYAAQSGTEVKVNGRAIGTIGLGEFIEHRTGALEPKEFTATKPIMVQQYTNGSDWDGVLGDPSMRSLTPVGQGLRYIGFATPKDAPVGKEFTNFIGVIAPAGATVYLDGANVSAQFSALGASGFLSATFSITPGSHVLTGTQSLLAWVYGFRTDEAYAYPAGANYLKAVGTVQVSAATQTPGVGSQNCITATVKDDANVALEGATVTFTDQGGVVIGEGETDAAGHATVCYVRATATVDTITATAGDESADTEITWKVGADDATLSALAPNTGTFQPGFNSAQFYYAMAVPNVVADMAINAVPTHPGATIESITVEPLGGSAADCPDANCPLVVGVNVIRVTALAEDGVTRITYTLVVTREAPTDAAPSEVLMHDNTAGSTHEIVNETSSGSPLFTMQVQIPAGAHGGEMDPGDIFYIIYTEILSPTGNLTTPPAGLQFAGNVFTLEAFFNDQWLDGYTFEKPVTLVLSYDEALLGGLLENTLELRYWDAESGTWSSEGIVVTRDPVTNTITVTLTRAGEFSWFGLGDPTSLTPWPQGKAGRLLLPVLSGN